jgi:hypothetical protein
MKINNRACNSNEELGQHNKRCFTMGTDLDTIQVSKEVMLVHIKEDYILNFH